MFPRITSKQVLYFSDKLKHLYSELLLFLQSRAGSGVFSVFDQGISATSIINFVRA